jgi:hypothetical protein
MSSSNCINADDGVLASPVRNRYFHGKLLDAYHLELEQAYGQHKGHLLNRLALGSGVLCGLQVAPTADGTGVAVGPGAAIDARGREIVVPATSPAVSPRQPTDACGRLLGDPIAGAATVLLCLMPHECEDEPVPVRAGSCCDADECAYSVVREHYALAVRQAEAPDTAQACALPGLFGAGSTPASIHAQLATRISQPPDEAGAGDPGVVLARITLPAADGDPITPAMIDQSVRPLVAGNALLLELLLCLHDQSPKPEPELTTIEQLSWTHDGQMSLDDFVDPDRGLTLTFSAPLDTGTVSPRHQGWFIVSVEYPVGAADGQHAPVAGTTIHAQRLDGSVTVSADARSITFRPAESYASTFNSSLTALAVPADRPPLCRVCVLCDMLLDADGNAVDGDFFGGVLPSGNRQAGGSFESWFLLEP